MMTRAMPTSSATALGTTSTIPAAEPYATQSENRPAARGSSRWTRRGRTSAEHAADPQGRRQAHQHAIGRCGGGEFRWSHGRPPGGALARRIVLASYLAGASTTRPTLPAPASRRPAYPWLASQLCTSPTRCWNSVRRPSWSVAGLGAGTCGELTCRGRTTRTDPPGAHVTKTWRPPGQLESDGWPRPSRHPTSLAAGKRAVPALGSTPASRPVAGRSVATTSSVSKRSILSARPIRGRGQERLVLGQLCRAASVSLSISWKSSTSPMPNESRPSARKGGRRPAVRRRDHQVVVVLRRPGRAAAARTRPTWPP